MARIVIPDSRNVRIRSARSWARAR